MKQKTIISAMTALVIAGLLITSAAGGITGMVKQPATGDLKKDVDYSCVEALATSFNRPNLAKAGALVSKNNIATQSNNVDMQTALVETNQEEKVEINLYQEPEQSRQFYIIDALHPAFGDSGACKLFLMYDYYFYNDSNPSEEFDGIVWTYSDDYGENWGDVWHWERDDGPLPSSYPSNDYWGFSTFDNSDQFFATWVNPDEDYWDPNANPPAWFNGTNVSIMRIIHNDSDPLNPDAYLRTWTGFGDDFWAMIMDDMACTDGLYFPEPYQDHDPWGMCSYIISNNFNPGAPGYPVLSGPHMFWPVEYLGSTNYGLMSWFINDPAQGNYVNGCEGTATYIDDVIKGGYAVWDPVHDVAGQRALMISKIYDMNVAFDYPAPDDNSYGVTWSLNDPNLDLEKPVIAANDGSVVIATQVDNATVPNEKWLSLWYCPNHNGEVGDQDNLDIAGIWSISGKEILYPEVSYIHDDIFMVTFIIDNEMYATFSWDGGESWCVNQSPDWLEYYKWSGDDFVISEYRTNELSDNAGYAIWEYDASTGGDFLTYLHYTPITVKLDGYCKYPNDDPVNPVYMEILNTNNDKEYPPDIEDNYYSRKLLLGLDIWTEPEPALFKITGADCSDYGVVEHEFTEIYPVNTIDIIFDQTRIGGDADFDGDVDHSDLGILLSVWGKCEGDESFNWRTDFDCSGCIDHPDLGILLANWGYGT